MPFSHTTFRLPSFSLPCLDSEFLVGFCVCHLLICSNSHHPCSMCITKGLCLLHDLNFNKIHHIINLNDIPKVCTLALHSTTYSNTNQKKEIEIYFRVVRMKRFHVNSIITCSTCSKDTIFILCALLWIQREQ